MSRNPSKTTVEPALRSSERSRYSSSSQPWEDSLPRVKADFFRPTNRHGLQPLSLPAISSSPVLLSDWIVALMRFTENGASPVSDRCVSPDQASIISYNLIGSVASQSLLGINRRIRPLGARSFSCLLYTSPSPRDRQKSRMPSSA